MSPEPQPATPPVAHSEFDPIEFWELHKAKIILLASLFVVAAAAFTAYSYTALQNRQEAQRLFATANSAEQYQAVIATASGTTAAGNARLLLAEVQRNEGKYDESAETLRQFIKEYPQHPLLSGAYISLGATLEAQGKTDEALEIYRQTASSIPGQFAVPLALLAEAGILKSRNQVEEARRVYESIITQFPESIFAQEAQRALKTVQ